MKAVKSSRIITPSGIVSGYLIIEHKKIVDITATLPNENIMVLDCGTDVVMAGLVDCHVHINEPGRTDWEGFETATKAAAAGGVTTLIEMPLNSSPVTTTVENFELKLKATKNKLHVNCGFWGGVVPENVEQIDELLQAGTFGIKAFLTHSGIDDFPNTTAKELEETLLILKKYNKPMLVHCELTEAHEDEKFMIENPTSYQAYLKSRPKSFENNAVALMINLCRKTGAHVHIVHVSSAEALQMVADAKKERLPLTAETCPHYLHFNAEDIPDAATTFKCAPPIREKANNEELWDALHTGILDFVVTDHSPATPNLKEIESGDFSKAWGGISSLQFLLPAFYTKAVQHHFSLTNVARLLSENTTKLIGLSHKKGKLVVGYDADIVVWNPEKKFIVEEKDIQHRHKITPYLNEELQGVVKHTFVGGELVYSLNEFKQLGTGELLLSK